MMRATGYTAVSRQGIVAEFGYVGIGRLSIDKPMPSSSCYANIFDAPDMPPSPIPADKTGRLTHDIEGRPLTARHVVGRRLVGGDDQALPPAEFNALAEALTGRSAEAVSAREMGRDAGRTALNRFTGKPLGIELRSNLLPAQVPRVYAHELGHAIDSHAAGIGGIPQSGLLNKELKPVYNTLNNPNRQRLPDGSWGDGAASWSKPVTPPCPNDCEDGP